MGQRFQAHYIMNEYTSNDSVELRKEGYHLQCCWGKYTLIRLEQVLSYMDKHLKEMYVSFHGSVFPTMEEGLKILESLTSINMINGSYVMARTVPRHVSNNPLNGDNNEGIFIIDLRGEIPRYALFNREFKQVNSSEYMNDYKSDLEEDKELILYLINKINNYEIIPERELMELYPDMYEELNKRR